jgi:hypothetical protein
MYHRGTHWKSTGGGPNFKEMVIHEMVRNFQRKIRPDDDDDEAMYNELTGACPLFGDPHSYYE